jgi:hypothetical protein
VHNRWLITHIKMSRVPVVSDEGSGCGNARSESVFAGTARLLRGIPRSKGLLPHLETARAGVKVVLLACALLVASCGGDDEGGAGKRTASAHAGWWLLEAPDFTLTGGGPADEAIAESTGQRWLLEYSNGVQTLQLSAWDLDSDFMSGVQQDPKVGSAELDGFEATLRQAPGLPSDDIAPSVGAEWVDGEVLVVLGGGALSEAELRAFLSNVRGVDRADWGAAVAGAP